MRAVRRREPIGRALYARIDQRPFARWVGGAILTGLPLSSRPVVQVTLAKGLPCRNSPVVRSST